MKQLFLLFVLCCSTTVFSQKWFTNFDLAKEDAAKRNTKLIMVFQGSDWCAPCIKLDRKIWATQEFKTSAEKKYTLLKVDFPRRKKNQLSKEETKANNELAGQFNTNGIFPLVVVFNSKGEKLGETSYKKMTVSEYINHLENL